MISRKDLEIAAKELMDSQPTYQTCAKLADIYIVLDHMKPDHYSMKGPGSDFLTAIDGKNIEKVLDVMNELMDATQVLNPRLYERVIERINAL